MVHINQTSQSIVQGPQTRVVNIWRKGSNAPAKIFRVEDPKVKNIANISLGSSLVAPPKMTPFQWFNLLIQDGHTSKAFAFFNEMHLNNSLKQDETFNKLTENLANYHVTNILKKQLETALNTTI